MKANQRQCEAFLLCGKKATTYLPKDLAPPDFPPVPACMRCRKKLESLRDAAAARP